MVTRSSDKDKKAGSDESVTQQTTKDAEDQKVSETVEDRGETDAKGAASGNVVGGVVDGEKTLVPEDAEVKAKVGGDKAEGALGTVAERTQQGEEYEVPWTYLTADYLPRTSDSDDLTKDWTAQHAGGEREGFEDEPVALVEVQGTPGQTFRDIELPNRAVVEAAGIDYDQWVTGLPVRADVPNETQRRGIPA